MVVQITDSIVDEADAYFLTRLASQAWTGATVNDQKAALATAANVLSTIEWEGRPVSSLYAFPRLMPDTRIPVTPAQLLWALFEQAIHLLANPGLLTEEETVDSLVAGPIQLKTIGAVELIPRIVKRYIAPYTRGGNVGGGRWWRAN